MYCGRRSVGGADRSGRRCCWGSGGGAESDEGEAPGHQGDCRWSARGRGEGDHEEEREHADDEWGESRPSVPGPFAEDGDAGDDHAEGGQEHGCGEEVLLGGALRESCYLGSDEDSTAGQCEAESEGPCRALAVGSEPPEGVGADEQAEAGGEPEGLRGVEAGGLVVAADGGGCDPEGSAGDERGRRGCRGAGRVMGLVMLDMCSSTPSRVMAGQPG